MLGFAGVTPKANGDASFSVLLSAGMGSVEAVTVTDPAGSPYELSGCVEAIDTVLRFNWHYEYEALYRLTYACLDWDNVATGCKSHEVFFRCTDKGVGAAGAAETGAAKSVAFSLTLAGFEVVAIITADPAA